MKTITLEKILQVLENGDNEIHVDDELRRNSKSRWKECWSWRNRWQVMKKMVHPGRIGKWS